MGRFISLALVVAAFLMISFSQCHGFGRKTLGSFDYGHTHRVLIEENPRAAYEADYAYAGPNFNSHSGFLLSPPYPPPPQPQDMN